LAAGVPSGDTESKTRNSKNYTMITHDPVLQATIKELSQQITDTKIDRI